MVQRQVETAILFEIFLLIGQEKISKLSTGTMNRNNFQIFLMLVKK